MAAEAETHGVDGTAALFAVTGSDVARRAGPDLVHVFVWGAGDFSGVSHDADVARRKDLDLVEANEAFAAQALAVNKDLGWDPAIVNVNGGAIAIGHPIGASGARVLTTLLHEMARRNAKKGLATLCIGGGMGIAMAVER